VGFFGWKEGLRRGGYLGKLSMEEFVMGRKNFDEWEGAGFSSVI
jgi:hypothetical protein